MERPPNKTHIKTIKSIKTSADDQMSIKQQRQQILRTEEKSKQHKHVNHDNKFK